MKNRASSLTIELHPGEALLDVNGRKLWYEVVGKGDQIPLLLLHGGPGAPSYYLNPFCALADERPVIFFDQLGCGRSERITDTSLLTIPFFVNQIEELRKALGLDSFYLYGQSWGTMLGMDYYQTYPEYVKAIIFSSPALSIPLWIRETRKMLETLSEENREAIRINEERGTYDAPEYLKALDEFYQRYVARKQPLSEDLVSTFDNISSVVYNYMFGPSEFNSTGILADYDRTPQLKDIKVPVLYIVGQYDEASPANVRYYHSLTPDSVYVEIPDAAHVTMHDAPGADVKAIREFLKGVKA